MSQAPIIPGQLPVGYCYPSSAQQFADDLMSISYAEIPAAITGVSFGPTDPGPAGHGRPWFNTTFGRLYQWLDGRWVARYETTNSPLIKMLFEGTEAELNAIDNPELSEVVAGAELTTGPFWEIDHNYDGRFPLGPGLLPLAALTPAIGDTGGADERTLVLANLPKHRHSISLGPDSSTSYLDAELTEEGRLRPSSGDHLIFETNSNTVVARTKETGGDTAFDTMPPYRACYIVKRTLRLYYVI